MKKLFNYLFGLYKENGQLIVKVFGIKIKFKFFGINQLEDVCCIQDLPKFKEQNTYFPHPVGIVIHPDVKIGKNCTIYQNVTIGSGKYSEKTNRAVPIIKDNVKVYANSVIAGGVTIGNNAVIGAGAIVLRDVEDDTTVAGNPARVIH